MTEKPEFYTVCKFKDFPMIQILREINFGESRGSKTAVFAILGSLNFVNLLNFRLHKVQKLIILAKFRGPKMAKTADLELLDYPKLISRKI